MNTQKILAKLGQKQNGSFFNIKWTSELPLTAKAKKEGNIAFKTTEAVVRKGVNYDNTKIVKDQVEAGTKVLTHKLPWGNWKKGYEGLIIENKGNEYLRLYTGANNKPKVTYNLNGKEMTKAELKATGLFRESMFKENASSISDGVFNINISNVDEIK